jgi:hypothetical protein
MKYISVILLATLLAVFSCNGQGVRGVLATRAVNDLVETPPPTGDTVFHINTKFNAWTADDPDNWTVFVTGGETGTNRVTENPAGVFQINSTGTLVLANLDSLTGTTDYEMLLYVKSVTTGDLKVWASDGASSTTSIHTGSETGTIHKYFTNQANDTLFEIKRNTGPTEFQIDSLKVFLEIGTPPDPPSGPIDIHVSVSGDGFGDGTIGDPWNMAQLKAELESAVPDSGTYGLKRGDRFDFSADSIVIDSNPSVGNITVTAYGTGDKPNISGAEQHQADSWTNEGGNLWYTTQATEVWGVHLNEKQALISQHPNGQGNGLEIATRTSNSVFSLVGYDAEDDVDADGGFCGVMGEPWEQQYAAISNTTNATVTLTTGIDGVLAPKVGGRVKLFDFKEGLDSQGEWWWDDPNNRLYLYSTTNPSSAYTSILATINAKFAFHLETADNVTLELLDLSHFKIASVQLTQDANNNTIQNCILRDNLMYGSYLHLEGGGLGGPDSNEFLSNEINNCNNAGIFGNSDVDFTLIDGNTIDSIGIYFAWGKFFISGDQFQNIIHVHQPSSDNWTVTNNTLTNSGGAAWLNKGDDHDFQDNIVNNNLRHVGDMGSVYNHSCDGFNAAGITVSGTGWDNGTAWFDGEDEQAKYGFYFDSFTITNARVDTTVVNNSSELTACIFVQSATNNLDMKGNTLNIVDNFASAGRETSGPACLFIKSTFTNKTALITWENTTMNADGNDASCIQVNDSDNTLMVNWTWPTGIDNNDYNVINSADFLYRNNGSTTETFADWKTDTGMDASSTFN